MSEALGVAVLEVKADISKLVKGLDDAKEYSDRTLRSAGQGMMAVGSTLTENVSRPIVGLIQNVAGMATEWESSFADVKKATSGTDTELATLSGQILDMSTHMPVKPEAIASIVALGGQLGIGRKDVTDFADTIARLGVSTNLTMDDAATKFAKFITITNGVAPAGSSASEQIRSMGNVLVALGNNSKTTETDIMNMSMRIAAAGNAVGMPQQQILGWGAALSSMGLTAQAGGSSISKAMQLMATAVAGGGKDLSAFAEVAQMTDTQFANLFKSDPSAAILAFAGGLNKVKESGGDLYGTLGSVGMRSSQLIDTMTRVSGNTGEVARILGVANTGYIENNALISESNKRFETSESKIQMAKNSLQVLGITIGAAVLPALVQILTALTPVIVQISQFAAANPEIVNLGLAFLAVAATVGPILTAIGSVMTFVGSLSAAMAFITPIVSTASAAIGAAIGAISLPVVLIGAAIAALALAWYNDWFGIQEATTAAWTFITTAFSTAKEFLITTISTLWETITTNFNTNIGLIQGTVTMFWDALKTTWNTAIEIIKTVTNTFFEALKTAWNTLSEALKTTVNTLWEAIKTAWNTACEAVKTVTGTFSEAIKTAWEGLKTAVSTVVAGLKTAVETTYKALTTAISTATTTFSAAFKTAWEGIKTAISTIWTAIKTAVTTTVDGLYESVVTKTGTFKDSVITAVTSLKDQFLTVVGGIKDGAISAISGMVDGIMGYLNGLIGSAGGAGSGMVRAFADGITGALDSALSAARSMAQALRDLLPGSDAKRGPLSDLTASGSALPATFAKGIDMTSPTLTRSVTGMISKSLTNNVTINNPTGQTARSSLIGTLQNMEFAI